MAIPPISQVQEVHFFRRYREIRFIGKALRWVGITLSMLIIPTAGQQIPTLAAERIYTSYSVLERSISVDALETYARVGKLDGDLAFYARYLNSQQLAQLRRVLLTPVDLSAVAVSQFLYTPIGETLLQLLGQVIKTESRQPGFYALRAALILAAADPEGLTLLNVLRKFPTRGIRIDLERSLDIASELERLVNQTNQAVALVSQQSTIEATAQPPVDFSQLPDLRLRGRFTWNKRTLTLYDRRRDRMFLADIYLPSTQAPAPVIVISHGLGSDRNSFEYLAEQLASYGFAVAVPEHPGSNSEQLRSLLAGRSNEVTQPSEFINRPLDVKYLLDELERLDDGTTVQLNLQQVGVIGQSFGGYTALALAGASLNFDKLLHECENINDFWNVSLLLQCRALQLPRTQYSLRDQRVKAAIAINPITSSIFGETGLSQIEIPVMLVSSSADKVAPALAEQILPFTWLTNPEKYLVLLEGGTHFSTIGETNPETNLLAIPSQVIGPDPVIAHRYMKALSVAFFQTYVAGAPQYSPYLSADYAQAISQALLNLSLVQSLPATPLKELIDS